MLQTGRFAPSPTGELHVGNLRTAVLAWLVTRSRGGRFILRIEDLDRDRSREEFARRQLADLAAIGLTWDGPVECQSTRDDAYREALRELIDAGHTFDCYCTRREIRDAQSAPHGTPGHYPGTCRSLSAATIARYRAEGRSPAIRLRGAQGTESWDDLVLGRQSLPLDDVVLARGDGAVAYNLAVVVDDLWQGVTTVVRGDDLVDSTPAQLRLSTLLGGKRLEYGHVPLALNSDGRRLAKRDGAVTIGALLTAGWTLDEVRVAIGSSLGGAIADPSAPITEWIDGFNIAELPAKPWTFCPPH